MGLVLSKSAFPKELLDVYCSLTLPDVIEYNRKLCNEYGRECVILKTQWNTVFHNIPTSHFEYWSFCYMDRIVIAPLSIISLSLLCCSGQLDDKCRTIFDIFDVDCTNNLSKDLLYLMVSSFYRFVQILKKEDSIEFSDLNLEVDNLFDRISNHQPVITFEDFRAWIRDRDRLSASGLVDFMLHSTETRDEELQLSSLNNQIDSLLLQFDDEAGRHKTLNVVKIIDRIRALLPTLKSEEIQMIMEIIGTNVTKDVFQLLVTSLAAWNRLDVRNQQKLSTFDAGALLRLAEKHVSSERVHQMNRVLDPTSKGVIIRENWIKARLIEHLSPEEFDVEAQLFDPRKTSVFTRVDPLILQNHFDRFDIDGDGLLSPSELQGMIGKSLCVLINPSFTIDSDSMGYSNTSLVSELQNMLVHSVIQVITEKTQTTIKHSKDCIDLNQFTDNYSGIMKCILDRSYWFDDVYLRSCVSLGTNHSTLIRDKVVKQASSEFMKIAPENVAFEHASAMYTRLFGSSDDVELLHWQEVRENLKRLHESVNKTIFVLRNEFYKY